MKKTLILAVLIMGLVGAANAQEQVYYGGKKGDVAVTFGLYNTIAGGYMLTDRVMIDAELQLSGGSSISEVYYNNDNDSYTLYYNQDNASLGTTLSVGANYLLNPGERLQASVGCRVKYGLSNQEQLTDYHTDSSDASSYNSDKLTCIKNNDFSLGATLNVEFFITPRLSVGGALGIYANYFDRVNEYETNPDSSINNKDITITQGFGFSTKCDADLDFRFYF